MKRAVQQGVVVAVLCAFAGVARGQGYGTDTQNVMTPAAGGMAGVSVALPQDVPAAVFGNPSTLSQFEGTQFTLGGGWAEGYPTITRFGFQDPRENFTIGSGTQGFVVPSFGLTQDLRPLGVPGTLGLGLAGLSGLGAEYRGRAPESSFANDVSSEYLVLGTNAGLGIDVTDRWSVGAALTLGTGFSQMGVVQSSALVHDYALRGTFGCDYDVNACNTVGVYYQTNMHFQFPNAFRLPRGEYRNINVDQPQTVGCGWANRRLLHGDLLLAADIYYKLWEDADLYEDIYVNQWAFAVGSQLTRGRLRYRLGYSYNTNPMNHQVGDRLSGLPVLQDQIQFLQAAETAVICQHRLTAGVGCQDVLIPGVDLDLFAGGLFTATDQFGDHTQVTVSAYYVGLGLTWRYGPCAAL